MTVDVDLADRWGEACVIDRALAVAPSIAFYRYQISFKLLKG
jgi:hypothetical protein